MVRELRLTILHKDLDYATEEGSKEIEIVRRRAHPRVRRHRRPVRPGETLTIQIDLSANEPRR